MPLPILPTPSTAISFFSFSVYHNENLTHETYVVMGMFSKLSTILKLSRQNVLQWGWLRMRILVFGNDPFRTLDVIS